MVSKNGIVFLSIDFSVIKYLKDIRYCIIKYKFLLKIFCIV